MSRRDVHIQPEATVPPALERPRTEGKPRIAVTMGDAAGIGPEIIVKALTYKSVYAACQPIVVGSAAILDDACLRFTADGPPLKLNIVETPDQAAATHGTIDVLDVCSLTPEDICMGTIDVGAGRAAVKAIETATHLTLQGELDAVTTAPLCKAAIHLAGVSHPGHTEMLAALTGTPSGVMMLCTPNALSSQRALRRDESTPTLNPIGNMTREDVPFAVSFVTNHIALTDVPSRLSVERILEVIRITREALIGCGISEPKLVVAGLNPHAGEDGVFGQEEKSVIRPAVLQAQAEFGGVTGPLPADTLFVKARRGEWDAVIVMYHDQGNIPIKLLGFGNLVNVTLGLPIIRTSVDHGTAFDIAGKGIADETSLVGALRCAAQLAR